MSEESDDSDKTEEPSQRKLEEARQKGQVPQSREITHWFMILSSGIIIMMMAPYVSSQLYESLSLFWTQPHDFIIDRGRIGSVLTETLWRVVKALMLPLIVLMVAAFLGTVIQFGLLFSSDNLQPKLERISILKGFGRIFSMRSVVELIKGVAKILIVGSVIFYLIFPYFYQSVDYVNYDMASLLAVIRSLAGKVLMGVVAVLTVIAAVDWLYQRLSFMNKMKMSKQELKDEYRQSEGDPMIKQRLRQIRMEKARQRMMAAVPKSTVVVTNPTHYAVALLFDQEVMGAPRVVAKGVDALALRIRAVAEENDVPIMENPPLARSLYATVELDDEIPLEYYKAVAEVIGYVLRLKKKK